jgi:ribonuclease HI
MNDTAVIYCDGLCEPNPGGTATYGWVIYWNGKPARQGYGFVCQGEGATNNVAEYTAAIVALEHLIEKHYGGNVLLRSDSQLLINQLKGSWQVRAERIIPLFQKVRMLAGSFARVEYEWIPREQNREADSLSWQAYHEHV